MSGLGGITSGLLLMDRSVSGKKIMRESIGISHFDKETAEIINGVKAEQKKKRSAIYDIGEIGFSPNYHASEYREVSYDVFITDITPDTSSFQEFKILYKNISKNPITIKVSKENLYTIIFDKESVTVDPDKHIEVIISSFGIKRYMAVR